MSDGPVPRDVFLAAVRIATGGADRVTDADRNTVRAWAREWVVPFAVRSILTTAADRGIAGDRT